MEKLTGLPCNKFADDLFLFLIRGKPARMVACNAGMFRATPIDTPGFLTTASRARSQNLPMARGTSGLRPQAFGSLKPIRVNFDPR